jgi:hypothetical protein
MAPSRSRTALFSLLAAASLLPSAVWAFDCKDVAASGVHFNLGELGGPHVVHWKNEDLELEMLHKYNFTVDICNKLKWHKGGSLATECHQGARSMFMLLPSSWVPSPETCTNAQSQFVASERTSTLP